MSSDNNNFFSNFDNEKLKKFGSKFGYYFDIFYRVIKAFAGFIALVLAVIVFLGGGAALGYFASLVEDIPTPTQAEMETQINDYNRKSTLYYADNSVISDLRSDLIRTPVTLDNISPLIINAVIATEDENYLIHEGVVPKALVRAAAQELTNASSVSGGSTLTQQLIKQQILSSEVTHSRKAIEILYAFHLENNFDKDQILEAYMNVSPFGRNNIGQNIAGIEEAAQGIFGVPASEVNLPQASFLAGLPQSPISYNPYTQSGDIKEDLSAGIYRQQEVLYSMFREGYITQEEYQSALEYDIVADFLQSSEEDENNSSHSYEYDLVENEGRKIIIDLMLEEDGITDEQLAENPALWDEYYEEADYEMRNSGYKIYSTIDPALHRAIQNRVTETQDQFGQTRTLTSTDDNGETVTTEFETQVGGTLTENTTGRVLAFVGNRSYEYSEFNNAFDSRRHSGSVIKPLITYGPALAENFITPATVIPDTELIVPSGGTGTHNIKNFGRTTNDWRDARYWLQISQNIPNTKIYLAMLDEGINPAKYIRALGIGPEAITDDEFRNPSTSLGGYGAGPTPTELAAAYSAIGNGGVFNSPYVIEKIENGNGEVVYEHEPNPTRVWSEAVNYILYDMLRDVTTEGTGRAALQYLNFSTDLASKTGTSDETVDVWFAGVTPKVSLVTWMGYDNQNLSLLDFNGLTPPQRNIRNWSNIMNVAHSVKPEILGVNERINPPADNSVTNESVLASTGMKSGRVSLPNNRTAQISGSTKTEMFVRGNVPGTTTYDFAVGAKSEELADFWSDYVNSQRRRRSNNNNSNNNNNDSDNNSNDDSDSEEEEGEEEDSNSSEEETEEETSEDESDSEEE
ncbi:transglycosylase domain-containing protein [Carnobacteriaceae bacterium 52-44]